MGPWAIDCLDLANNSFFEIESALAPAEDFSDRAFTLEAVVNRVPHHSMMEVNLARPTARLESESPATLTHAAHLENLRGRKLVEVADERMARVSSFGDV